jgi:hypothetical protein
MHGKDLIVKQFAVILMDFLSSSSFPAIILTAWTIEDTSDFTEGALEFLVVLQPWPKGTSNCVWPELGFSHFPV